MCEKEKLNSNDLSKFSKLCEIKQYLNSNYTFPLDFAPNKIPFGVNQSEKFIYNPNLD